MTDAKEPELTTSDPSVARKMLLRFVASALVSHLSRRAVICALLAGSQAFISGYLGHLPYSESALVLASPIITANSRPRAYAVLRQEQ